MTHWEHGIDTGIKINRIRADIQPVHNVILATSLLWQLSDNAISTDPYTNLLAFG
jgi:hypothetical protein